jgi:hypothetical protein
MKLYYAPGACSLADHIALLEADLKVDLVKVNLKTHTLDDGRSYRDINNPNRLRPGRPKPPPRALCAHPPRSCTVNPSARTAAPLDSRDKPEHDTWWPPSGISPGSTAYAGGPAVPEDKFCHDSARASANC